MTPPSQNRPLPTSDLGHLRQHKGTPLASPMDGSDFCTEDDCWCHDLPVPKVEPKVSVNMEIPTLSMRSFETGATRAPVEGRIDGEAYLSPLVLERFSEYMLKHQVTVTGEKREGDNWQKGIPKDVYMKGLWRHFLHLWQRHRGWNVKDPLAAANIEEDLCALFFGVQGYLHEILKERYK